MRTMLTIDWDYFIPEKPEWDFGHQENGLFLNLVWEPRAVMWSLAGKDYRKEMQTSGKEKTFWNDIRDKFSFDKNVKVEIGESHALACLFACSNEIERVINFDAHSDLGYGNEKPGDIECGNWLKVLMDYGIVKSATIVYPEHSLELDNPRNKWKRLKDVNFTTLDKFSEKDIEVSAIYICRSGCWTPPWLDDDFFKFIESSGMKVEGDVHKDVHKREWDHKKVIEGAGKQNLLEHDLLARMK